MYPVDKLNNIRIFILNFVLAFFALTETYPWLSFLFLRRLSLALNAAAPPFSAVDVDEAPAPMDCDEFISGGANAEEEAAALLAASLALSAEAADDDDKEDTPAVFDESAPAGAGADDVDEATKSSVDCRFALI